MSLRERLYINDRPPTLGYIVQPNTSYFLIRRNAIQSLNIQMADMLCLLDKHLKNLHFGPHLNIIPNRCKTNIII